MGGIRRSRKIDDTVLVYFTVDLLLLVSCGVCLFVNGHWWWEGQTRPSQKNNNQHLLLVLVIGWVYRCFLEAYIQSTTPLLVRRNWRQMNESFAA